MHGIQKGVQSKHNRNQTNFLKFQITSLKKKKYKKKYLKKI